MNENPGKLYKIAAQHFFVFLKPYILMTPSNLLLKHNATILFWSQTRTLKLIQKFRPSGHILVCRIQQKASEFQTSTFIASLLCGVDEAKGPSQK